MAKKNKTYTELIEMAKKYGVDDNAMFINAVEQYTIELDIIKSLKNEIDRSEITTTKSYQKDADNLYVNPCIAQIPKHVDSCNKTLKQMLDIITTLGKEPKEAGKLDAFLNE